VNQQQGQPPPFAPAPPRGYWLLHLTAQEQKNAVTRGTTRAAKRFVEQVKFGVDKLVRREPNSAVRLETYRAKPQDLWFEQRAKFPDVGEWWDFRHCMEDWMRLAPVDPVRDAVVEYIVEKEAELAQQQASSQLGGPPGGGIVGQQPQG
jgi:hypothetical protein